MPITKEQILAYLQNPDIAAKEVAAKMRGASADVDAKKAQMVEQDAANTLQLGGVQQPTQEQLALQKQKAQNMFDMAASAGEAVGQIGKVGPRAAAIAEEAAKRAGISQRIAANPEASSGFRKLEELAEAKGPLTREQAALYQQASGKVAPSMPPTAPTSAGVSTIKDGKLKNLLPLRRGSGI